MPPMPMPMTGLGSASDSIPFCIASICTGQEAGSVEEKKTIGPMDTLVYASLKPKSIVFLEISWEEVGH